MSPWTCPFSTFIFDVYSIAHYITTSLFSKYVQEFLIVFTVIFFVASYKMPSAKCQSPRPNITEELRDVTNGYQRNMFVFMPTGIQARRPVFCTMRITWRVDRRCHGYMYR